MGENAQGKTSILEALSLITQLKSFRASSISELINQGEDQASVSVSLSKPTASDILIGLEGNKKSIRVDGKKIASKAKYDFLGTSVSFVPDDLYLIKGGPDQRREYIDQLAINLDPNVSSKFTHFQKTLRSRNRLLKDFKEARGDEEQLELWTDQFMSAAFEIYKTRQACLNKIRAILPKIHAELFQVDEAIKIEYDNGYETEVPTVDEYQQRLDRLKEAERAVGHTLAGPHRDDIKFDLDKLSARSFASQGQTRSLVIALKIAQLELTQEARQWSPLLLLDDIISELDEKRTEALVNYLASYAGQLFVSTAESNKLKALHQKFSQFKLIDLASVSGKAQSFGSVTLQ